ncbi:MAG TPA: hypothetical protein VIN59_06560 [Alphaproteobacteria bacterium]
MSEKMSLKDFWNGRTISDTQRAHFPGKYNSQVAWARRSMMILCGMSLAACFYVTVAGTVNTLNPVPEAVIPDTPKP